MKKLIFQVIAGILGIYLAVKFVPGVSLDIIPGQSLFLGIPFTANWQILILAGAVLGFFNFILKPILNLIAFPLKLLTLGLFAFVINMFLVWLVALLLPEFKIQGLVSLFLATLIIWLTSAILRWI